jgi:transcriptional regulator with GAF, ATPase, and Fis domain
MNALSTEPRLVAVAGLMCGEVFPLAGPQVTIGRDPDNTISFPDPALSRRHCMLQREGGGWSVQDLHSWNGTFVNGVQIGTYRLTEGDRISVGGSVLVLMKPAPATAAPQVDVVESDVLAATRTLAADDTRYLKPVTAPTVSRTEKGLRALLRISTVISAVRGEPELYRELLRVLRDILPAEAAAVIIRRDEGELEAAEAAGSLEVSRSLVRRVLTDRIGVLSQDVAASRTFAADRNSLGGARSLLCAPIVLRETSLGAFYLVSPVRSAFDEDHLQLVTAAAHIAAIAIDNVRNLAAVEREAERLRGDLQLAHNLVGSSPPMQRVYELLQRVARADTTVLVAGETGTGKELAARAIHLNSGRARRPFVAVNCAALAETLLESELFGHERGAFSGAIAQKKGRLELADSGTLFLDEVGELAPALQSKLLRALQEREFERVGGTRPIKVDIRLIAASNRNLADEVRAGRFREDLYFRLNVVRIEMPPLRERRSDIPSLARYFLTKYAHKAGRRVSGISESAIRSLEAYRWPGNVRELENAIERAVVLGSTETVLEEDLPEDVMEAAIGPLAASSQASLHAAVLEAKRKAVVQALDSTNGNYTEAARALGVHPNYLHRLARNLGLKGDD